MRSSPRPLTPHPEGHVCFYTASDGKVSRLFAARSDDLRRWHVADHWLLDDGMADSRIGCAAAPIGASDRA